MTDAALLKLEARFNANSDREERAADKVETFEAEIDRLRKRMRKAERKHDRRTEAGSRLFSKVMATRATTIAGMMVKVRVRERWNTDDQESEVTILNSLVADIKAMGEAQP